MTNEQIIKAVEDNLDFLDSGNNVVLIFDSEGREVRRFASEGPDGLDVDLTPGESAELVGTVMIHVHAYDAPHGPQCLAEAMKFNNEAAVILSPSFVFILRRPEEGWPAGPVRDIADYVKAMLFAQMATEVQTRLMEEMGVDDDSSDEEVMRMRQIHMTRLAEQMGADYHVHQRQKAEV